MTIPSNPNMLTGAWLNAVLHTAGALKDATITSFVTQMMGDAEGLTGSGQMARLHLTYDQTEVGAPQTLIAKFSSPDPVVRATCRSLELYEREVRFYQELAHQVELRTPICYYSALDREVDFCLLLLEDLAPVTSGGDNYALCTFAEAELTMRELAKFHAIWWESPKLAELTWLRREPAFYQKLHDAYQQCWEPFLAKVGGTLAPAFVTIGEQFARNPGNYWRQMLDAPQTIIHNDTNLGNLLFLATPTGALSLAVVDWQVISIGHGLYDVALFLGRHLPPDDRQAKTLEFLRLYHTTLIENGVQGYPFDQCLHDFRLFLLTDLWRAVFFIGGGQVTNNEVRAFSQDILPRCSRSLLDYQVGELLPE